MKILVLNSGSSSIKCQYFVDRKSTASILIERIGEKEGHARIDYDTGSQEHHGEITDHHHALTLLFSMLREAEVLKGVDELDAVGHRVVHGGATFDQPTLIGSEVIETIRRLIPLAPLHNPANLEGIEVLSKLHPTLRQVAVFDTAFHQTMPAAAYLYPLPYEIYQHSDVRRYGFHGTSHAYVAKQAAKMLNRELDTLNLITLHLGNGASVAAIKEGKSIDTSMGLTPLEGLMMGTRCGDIDPAILPFLSRNLGMDIDRIDAMLNKESGLKGICGTNDMREVIDSAESGAERSLLALEMYTYRIKKYIGSYAAVLGDIDAIVFTGGIGEHAVKVRTMACEGLDRTIGLKLDEALNRQGTVQNHAIDSSESRIGVLVVQTDEELEIADQTEAVISQISA